MSLVRLSLVFICLACMSFNARAIIVLSGMEMIMIATPTKADQPRRSYNEMNAKMIYGVLDLRAKLEVGNAYLKWTRYGNETVSAQVL